ncbi:hypothetical protein [Syntrophomonas curvata]
MIKPILLKYCGGCNPVINRSKVVDEIKYGLPSDMMLTCKEAAEKPGLGIMMCGCSSACLDRDEIRQLADEWIIVSGSNVDLFPIDTDELSIHIIKKIVAQM